MEENRLTIEKIENSEDWERIREQWNALSERCVYPNPFTSWDWQRTWWKWFAPELKGELFILLIRRESTSEIVGIVPFYRRKQRSFLFLEDRQLRFIGYGGRTCPEYLGPILLPDAVEDAVDAIVDFLKNDFSAWDSIFFEDYALDDPGTARLAEKLHAAFPCHAGPGETRRIVVFTGDYDDYMATLSYNSRRQRRKRFNQAGTRYGARIEYPENVDDVFPILVDLTTRARTRHEEENPFLESVYAGFHHELLKILLPRNQAVLALLFLNEQPAAIWYCFLLGKKCYAYQQGFSPEFEGSPSDVCQQFLIRRLTSEGYREFDYLRGHESYKDSVANGDRETEWMFIFRRRGILFRLRVFLDRIVRPLYRRVKRFVRKESS